MNGSKLDTRVLLTAFAIIAAVVAGLGYLDTRIDAKLLPVVREVCYTQRLLVQALREREVHAALGPGCIDRGPAGDAWASTGPPWGGPR